MAATLATGNCCDSISARAATKISCNLAINLADKMELVILKQ
jgi:hypothetical protein